MKKILLLSTILIIAGCDDSPNVRSAEFFLKNSKEREVVMRDCVDKLRQYDKGGSSLDLQGLWKDYPECKQAMFAHMEIETKEMLHSEISAKAFQDNQPAALRFASVCKVTEKFLPSDHPTCKALISLQSQLQKKCKGQQNQTFECNFNDKLSEGLGIKN